MKPSLELVKKIAEQQCEPLWLIHEREMAWKRYESFPEPTVKDEMWKYIHPKDFESNHLSIDIDPIEVLKVQPRTTSEHLHSGVIVEPIHIALKRRSDLIKSLLKEARRYEMAKLDVLHEALWQSGIFIYVPPGVVLSTPICSTVSFAAGQSTVFPYTIIIVDENASASVIDEMVVDGTHPSRSFSNAFRYMHVKTGGRLQYVNIETWNATTTHFETQVARVASKGFFQSVNVGLGGSKSKFNIHTVVEGEGAEAHPMGVFFGDGQEHFDVYTIQDHRAPQTMSDLLFKSALKDAAQFSYQGVITMPKEAQRSDAYQANKNLLLSPHAKARSIPKLEIVADDIRCKHSATVGTIEPDETFYLESRGLSREEAVKMMVEGFFEQVLEKIPSEEIKQKLRSMIKIKLTGGQ